MPDEARIEMPERQERRKFIMLDYRARTVVASTVGLCLLF
jgi:hypothetical protein